METGTKGRSDIALTLELTRAIFERLETGLPLIKRGSKYLLLEGQKWANKVPVGTYNTWRTRNTVPKDSVENKGFGELLVERRQKIADEQRKELVRLGQRGMSKILSLSITQKKVEKSINKNGEYRRKIIEQVNPAIINAKMKVISFTIERLDTEKYGRHANARKKMTTFSLANLRKVKHEIN